MRKPFLFFLFLLFMGVSSAQDKADVLHYKFQLTLSDVSDTIKGNASIRFRALEPLSSFSVDLVKEKMGKGMHVSAVYEGEKTNNPLAFTFANDKVTIHFPDLIKTGEEKLVTIIYAGVPADGLIISKNKYGERTYFGDNWPDRTHNWIPCIDRLDDKASFEFWVTAPAEYKVVSNGFLAQEKMLNSKQKLTVWKEDVPLPALVMVIGVARFAVKVFDDSPAGIPVSAWVFRQDSANGFLSYSVAPAIIKFFTNYIGPYPYNKLANVQSQTIFGGMENASAIFYAESSALGLNEEVLMSHEIAHQWFGDMVTEKSFAHLWLSEGFATYFTHIYTESRYGTIRMEHDLKKDREQVLAFGRAAVPPVIDTISPYMQLLNADSYQKGGWVLHMLRRQLGDSVFRKSIQVYYATYAGGNAGTDDLRKIFESVSGKDLTQFFRQWLYSAGNPKLSVSWRWIADEKKLEATITQLQPNTVFSFPLDIEFDFASGKKIIKTIETGEVVKTISWSLDEKPASLRLDPHTSLLFEGTLTESK